jgi:hypothetical protein
MSFPMSKLGLLVGLGAFLATAATARAQFPLGGCANCNKNLVPPNVRLRPQLPGAPPPAPMHSNFPAVGPGAGFGATGNIVSTPQGMAPQATGNGTSAPALAPQNAANTLFNAGYANPFYPGSPFGGYGMFGGYGYPYGGYGGYGVYGAPAAPFGGYPYYANPFSGVPFPNPFYSTAPLANPGFGQPVFQGMPAMPN